MPYAELTITVPKSVWISELSRAYPETRFRVLAATANTASGVARIEILGDDADTICAEFREYDSVTDLTVFDTEAGTTRVQVETTVPLLLTSLQDSGVPLEMPFEVVDGQMTLEATLPQETLSELGETLDDFGIQYTVERIRQEPESDSLLTERQEWVLDEAIERGYYDTPRRTTLVDLADELGVAKSTCSEILHRAEGRVLKEYRDDDAPSEVVASSS
ncbi:bacterio-opsin activator [Halomicrobium mukohataei]|uniref:Bacterio-opsin activator n=1 Tax=Halomicrobium mukohataei TaxID=57705 RepID=A0A847UEM6_9EURY|nr:helix-turn-helix domain-containing protein [Halomicrobium mukohataei]NLV11679.1 bacterio-opsin activator [Halomicrobium mukohataei]